MQKIINQLLIALSAISMAITAAAEEIKIEHGGITMNANLEVTGDDWKSGDVLLMTHGTLAHGQMEIMATLQELLLERDISSLAITLSLGLDDRHGMYDCKIPHNHKHADAIDEIGVWLDWLEQQGSGKVTLLGHSRGGNQVAWFASKVDRPSINKIVLVAPSILSGDKNANDYKKRFAKELAPVFAEAESQVKAGNADRMMENIDFIYCEDTKATAGSVVGYYTPFPEFDTPSVIRQISKPVKVIAGSEDTVVPDLETILAPLVDDGAVSLTVIDGADHFFRDLYAEEMVDAIEELLGE